eukprot:Skav202742  [mRNA]  locus=scaffold1326:408064:409565:- [translate_table: standard]
MDASYGCLVDVMLGAHLCEASATSKAPIVAASPCRRPVGRTENDGSYEAALDRRGAGVRSCLELVRRPPVETFETYDIAPMSDGSEQSFLGGAVIRNLTQDTADTADTAHRSLPMASAPSSAMIPCAS